MTTLTLGRARPDDPVPPRRSLASRAQQAWAATTDRALGRLDPQTGLLRLRAFLRDGEALLQSCRQRRQPITLAVFNAGDVLNDSAMDPAVVTHYRAALVETFRAIAGQVGLVARTASAEFTVLMPLANERVARSMVAHEFGQLRARMAGALALAGGALPLQPPACAVCSIAEGDATLEMSHYEASMDVLQLCASLDGFEEEEEPRTRPLAGQPEGSGPIEACDGALVAMEVDPMEWVRANEHPTTIRAPLPTL